MTGLKILTLTCLHQMHFYFLPFSSMREAFQNLLQLLSCLNPRDFFLTISPSGMYSTTFSSSLSVKSLESSSSSPFSSSKPSSRFMANLSLSWSPLLLSPFSPLASGWTLLFTSSPSPYFEPKSLSSSASLLVSTESVSSLKPLSVSASLTPSLQLDSLSALLSESEFFELLLSCCCSCKLLFVLSSDDFSLFLWTYYIK